MSRLPTDYQKRKNLPLFTFLTKYFPDAVVEIVKVAVAGNVQHNGSATNIRWAREKSTDQLNTAMRHLWDYSQGLEWETELPPEVLAAIGERGISPLAQAAWRIMAELQLSCEAAAKRVASTTHHGYAEDGAKRATPAEEQLHANPESGPAQSDVRGGSGSLHDRDTAVGRPRLREGGRGIRPLTTAEEECAKERIR